MNTAPRILRTMPTGPITSARAAIPVLVVLHWVTGEETEIEASAVGWTQDAVHIEWRWKGELRTDWVPAHDVRRPGQPRRPPNDPPPPRSQRPRRR